MAYMNQERKAKIKANLDAALKGTGVNIPCVAIVFLLHAQSNLRLLILLRTLTKPAMVIPIKYPVVFVPMTLVTTK